MPPSIAPTDLTASIAPPQRNTEKEACQLLASGLILKADIMIAFDKIAKTATKIADLKAVKQYGIGVFDTITADLETSIGAIASSVTKNMMETASSMITDPFELIFGAILKILLIAPSNIFGLISFPQEAAIEATSKERMYIDKAYINLQNILAFFSKWKGKGSVDYYNQMKEAMPYLIEAMRLFDKLLLDLKFDVDDTDANIRFNEDVFKVLGVTIDKAIKITTPIATLSRESGIVERIEALKNKKYKEKSTAILNDHRTKLNKLKSDYRENTQHLINDNSVKSLVKLDLIRTAYGFELKALNLWKTEKLAVALVKSESEALISGKLWRTAGNDLLDSFVDDCKDLSTNLLEFSKNISKAFVAYKSSRIYCNNMYDMKDIIIKLIKEMIKLMRTSSNASSVDITEKLKTAQSFVEFTKDEFAASIELYLKSSQQASSIEMATSILMGNGALITADTILNLTVTQSMIDLLNLDDLLDDKSGEFKNFVDKLKNIKDWDGKTGVWAVHNTTGVPSPYIQLVADASTMLMKSAVLSSRNKTDDITNIENAAKEAFRSFRIIKNHNREVSNVLSSYTPYSGTDILDLKRILDSTGLSDKWAKGMSVLTLLVELIYFGYSLFNSESINYIKCKDKYPDDFDDPRLIIADTRNKANLRTSLVTSNNSHNNTEQVASDTFVLNNKIKATNIPRIYMDDILT